MNIFNAGLTVQKNYSQLGGNRGLIPSILHALYNVLKFNLNDRKDQLNGVQMQVVTWGLKFWTADISSLFRLLIPISSLIYRI